MPPLEIIVLDTLFVRALGGGGNLDSWPFAVLLKRVPAAFAEPVVIGRFADVRSFIEAGRNLVDRGAVALTTTCGFLVRHQRQLQNTFAVPALSSTLTQFARLQAALSARRVAILTIDAGSLDSAVRAAAGIPHDALVFALARNSHFVSAILSGNVALDIAHAGTEGVNLALSCQRQHPNIGLWLFECANMPPFAAAVMRATGLPVYDVLTLGRELHAKATA